MQKFILLIVFTLICTNVQATSSQANDNTIYWQTYHRPPGIIKTGDTQGTGFVEKALTLVIQQMPEYNHKFPIATLSRALRDMKASKNVCHPALFKTKERQQYLLFSNASMISPANQVISLTGTLEQASQGKHLDLVKLLENEQFAFTLIKGRSYGQKIDDKIGKHIKHSKSHLIPGTDLTALFQMVYKKRVDFTIAYPFELNYYLHKNKISTHSFTSYYIHDIPQFQLGYIACPKSEWGAQVIKKINTVLSETKHTDSYKQAITSWWEGEQSSKEFDVFYKTQFLKY